ncbi:YihY family inner membrane protein [Porticoccaceae bacterium]|jgi:membrane protein|nr:YihY family inner membrane protein [Porticoccaceae bacterium]
MVNQLLSTVGSVPRQLAISCQFLVYALRRFLGDGCPQSAAALTYMSLFAIVPMLTLMYSMFSLVPAFQELGGQVEEFIFSKFLPSSGQEITQYLSEFSNQARKLSVAGVAIILVTALLMLSNIEKTFNHIWATTGSRKGLAGFLVYWAILSLGPLLLAVGMIMSTYLMSLRLMVTEVDSLGLVALLFSYLPWLLTWLAFTLLYVAVPNCKVRVVYAAFGGLITTLLFETAKALFGQLVAHSIYTNVYGAFAVIPLFLIWIYLLWMLILFGAELVRSLETFQYQGRDTELPDLLAVLIILWQCWRRQQKGRSLSDRSMGIIGLNVEQWRRLRNVLLGQGVLEKTASGQYVMIRDADTIRLVDISGWLGQGYGSDDQVLSEKLVKALPWIASYDGLMRENRQMTEQNMTTSLQKLFSSNNYSQDAGDLNEN